MRLHILVGFFFKDYTWHDYLMFDCEEHIKSFAIVITIYR